MSLLHIGGSSGTSVVPAEGIDMDGVNDYLSRSTDLVGNVDSKTFTFSCWVYVQDMSIGQSFVHIGANGIFHVARISSTQFRVLAYNTVPTVALNVSFDAVGLGFLNILISCDLTNTSNRYMYVNDSVANNIVWPTYTNDFIDFTQTSLAIGGAVGGTGKLKGRLSNIFLDYTYRDLSIEANRRLFITADGKPTPTATLKALNPILYLPMKDAATAHINEGTGGNFVQNGTLDTASRGANQDNCKASYFDGTADYLSRTSLTGIADGKVFTLSFNINIPVNDAGFLMNLRNTTSSYNVVNVEFDGSNRLDFKVYNGATLVLRNYLQLTATAGKNFNIQISFDLTDTLKRHFVVNGVLQTHTWDTYLNQNIPYSTINSAQIMAQLAASFLKANIGELYFDTRYTDLAASNPFWDSVANRPKPVRQVIAETGITPLIAMPLDASNAGKNYGTGGDFTANSAPYVGARGGSEFWARSAKFDGSTGYLSRGALSGAVDSKQLSFMCYINHSNSNVALLDSAPLSRLSVALSSTSEFIRIVAKNSVGTVIFDCYTSVGLAKNAWQSVFISIDLSDTTKRKIYINGNAVVDANITWTTYINDYIDFTNTLWTIGSDYIYSSKVAGSMTMFVDNKYIDFGNELTRLKYHDQLGYPKDLKAQIDAGVIPTPLIYLPFDDTSNLGKNLGTGGNFTVNGTVTQGADVNG